jgi:GT2 family glycosyltransferase
MTRLPRVAVILCAYTLDRWDDLVAAVQSVARQTQRADQTIVVIDHNPTLLAHARAAFPEAMVIENSQPQGLSGARSSGVAATQAEIVAFLDDDALAAPDWLAALTQAYTDPAVMGTGGAIEPRWDTARPAWFPQEFDWVVGCTYRGMPMTPTPVRNLIGCNMSFRREVFDAVGSFRSGMGRVGQIPLGCEETEFCIRLRQRWPSSTLLYTPEARVQHRVPASRTAWAYFRARCYSEGLSKAQVTHLVGAGDGLSTERAYTLRTLPSGMLQGLTAALRGDLAGLARAGAIGAGLALTASGYLMGKLRAGATNTASTSAQAAPVLWARPGAEPATPPAGVASWPGPGDRRLAHAPAQEV